MKEVCYTMELVVVEISAKSDVNTTAQAKASVSLEPSRRPEKEVVLRRGRLLETSWTLRRSWLF